jgi:hypothetical protein
MKQQSEQKSPRDADPCLDHLIPETFDRCVFFPEMVDYSRNDGSCLVRQLARCENDDDGGAAGAGSILHS